MVSLTTYLRRALLPWLYLQFILRVDAQVDQLLVNQSNPQTPPDLALAIRQQLFDFGMDIAVQLVEGNIADLEIPDYRGFFDVSWIGTVFIEIKDVACEQVRLPKDKIRLRIEDEAYRFKASDVETLFTFHWHWDSHGLGGSGTASVYLHGGNFNLQFAINGGRSSPPQIFALDSGCDFDQIDIGVKSASLDWLYQLLLNIFYGTLVDQIKYGLQYELMYHLPMELNDMMKDLPTSFKVKGLPFATEFSYDWYTKHLVLLRGYGQINIPPTPADNQKEAAENLFIQLAQAVLDDTAVAVDHDGSEAQGLDTKGRTTRKLQRSFPGLLIQGEPRAKGGPLKLRYTEATAQATEGDQHQVSQPHYDAATRKLQSGLEARGDQAPELLACPYYSSDLAMSAQQIEHNEHMATLYASDSTARCILWALLHEGMLQGWISNESQSSVTFSTMLLSILIPGIINDYPQKPVRFFVEVLEPPVVQFQGEGVVRLEILYQLSVYVETNRELIPKPGDEPQATPEELELECVAVLNNRQQVQAEVRWDYTKPLWSKAHHEVVESPYALKAALWDGTLDFVMYKQGSSVVLEKILKKYFELEMVPELALVDQKVEIFEGWAGLSVNAELTGEEWSWMKGQ